MDETYVDEDENDFDDFDKSADEVTIDTCHQNIKEDFEKFAKEIENLCSVSTKEKKKAFENSGDVKVDLQRVQKSQVRVKQI